MKKGIKLGLSTLTLGLGLFAVSTPEIEAKTNMGNGVHCGHTWESCEVDWGEYTHQAVDRAVQSYSTALVPGVQPGPNTGKATGKNSRGRSAGKSTTTSSAQKQKKAAPNKFPAR